MKTAARFFSIAALVVLLLATTGAFADSHVRIVRLSYLQGDVNIDLGQGAGSQRAMLNMPIVEGSRLWTGNDGQAEIEFEDGSSVRITPNTGLEFVALSLRDSGARVNVLKVVGGTAYVDVPKLAKEDVFTFQLPNRELTLNHSVHFRIDMDGMEARLAVFKGEIGVIGTGRNLDVKKGETLTLNLSDAGRYNLADNVASLAYDAWDKDRDDVIRDAFNSNRRNNGWYPYGYGFADLMNYGSIFAASGYGNCWRPYGVGMGWDPFDYGYWSYYPGFGYTWVSGYPWGWAPYRYGGWSYISGTGFSWCPSMNRGNWRQWNVTPVVISPPPVWRAPHRPDKPNGGVPPPIVPVGGRRGPGPYRGGLVEDKPSNGSGGGSGAPTTPEDRRGPSGKRPTINTDASAGGGSPSGGGTPAPMIANPTEQRSHGPRPTRNIDTTPPGGAPAGTGPSYAHRPPPIESPAPAVRTPSPSRGGDSAPSGGRFGNDRGAGNSNPGYGGHIGGGGGGGASSPSPAPMAPQSAPPAPSPAPAPHSAPPPSEGHGRPNQ